MIIFVLGLYKYRNIDRQKPKGDTSKTVHFDRSHTYALLTSLQIPMVNDDILYYLYVGYHPNRTANHLQFTDENGVALQDKLSVVPLAKCPQYTYGVEKNSIYTLVTSRRRLGGQRVRKGYYVAFPVHITLCRSTRWSRKTGRIIEQNPQIVCRGGFFLIAFFFVDSFKIIQIICS